MTNGQPGVRMNYVAIVVAAIASCAAQGAWYRSFLAPWLRGIGRTPEWWMSPAAKSPLLQNGTALIASAVIATAISCVIQATGAQTAWRGLKVGVLLWLGFVMPIWSIEYAFEVRPLSLLGINAGFWLVGMSIMGVIVGRGRAGKRSNELASGTGGWSRYSPCSVCGLAKRLFRGAEGLFAARNQNPRHRGEGAGGTPAGEGCFLTPASRLLLSAPRHSNPIGFAARRHQESTDAPPAKLVR